MKILVINGPNLNLLGVREPELYGKRDFAALEAYIRASCRELGAECELFQSNHEGAIVDAIQSALGRMDGIVINPAAYTHTSVAILDALRPWRSRRWRCISPIFKSARASGTCPTRAWRAKRRSPGWALRATGERSNIL